MSERSGDLIIIALLGIGLVFTGIENRNEISRRDKQMAALQTQLADAKESQRHADMKFNLCMRQLK